MIPDIRQKDGFRAFDARNASCVSIGALPSAYQPTASGKFPKRFFILLVFILLRRYKCTE